MKKIYIYRDEEKFTNSTCRMGFNKNIDTLVSFVSFKESVSLACSCITSGDDATYSLSELAPVSETFSRISATLPCPVRCATPSGDQPV